MRFFIVAFVIKTRRLVLAHIKLFLGRPKEIFCLWLTSVADDLASLADDLTSLAANLAVVAGLLTFFAAYNLHWIL